VRQAGVGAAKIVDKGINVLGPYCGFFNLTKAILKPVGLPYKIGGLAGPPIAPEARVMQACFALANR
jgi:hypothetical protein